MVNWKTKRTEGERGVRVLVCVCQVIEANIPYDVRVRKKKRRYDEMRGKNENSTCVRVLENAKPMSMPTRQT